MAENAKKTEKAEKAPKKKAPKTKSTIRFSGPEGELVIVTNQVNPKQVQTWVVHIKPHPTELNSKGAPKKIRKRGLSEVHTNPEAAVDAARIISDKALKMGWVLKTRRARSRADTFTLDTLPAPVLKPSKS